ncbi:MULTISPECIES: winged helix-turn-helix domain-containing protein [unclassified Streptomyces]|uniref:winged helix-turn-helix domain-containing protein n=1 Tax=unclassified Streptomyces TaxID=2593676 RepID=UPI00224F0E58|nr:MULTISPECIES: winged helix-turn-helix domain-containing protein [unclassified Streptomyces]MCX4828412.1 winged helix-turn-helix domain-containing protein [Streptomyces sp. NBC_01016]
MVNANTENAPRPTAEEIADALRKRIIGGELRAGERLPTQAALAREFGVERGTVRNALQLLRSEGLLANTGKGSPPTVSRPERQSPPGAQAARSILGPRLVAAFEAPQVYVDVASLTGETLVTALGEPLRKVYEKKLRPESVRVRMVVPRPGGDVDYPAPAAGWGVDDKLDTAVKQRSRIQWTSQQMVLDNTFKRLRDNGVDVSFEFRFVSGVPTRKVYLLNRQEVLVGHYVPDRFEREIDDYEGADTVELVDVEGFETEMFPFERSNGEDHAAFVDGEQAMFDGLWEHVAQQRT